MIPKGKLLIIGGHEDKGLEGERPEILNKETHASNFELLGSLMTTETRAHQVIEIIAAASSIPAEMEEMYMAAYKNAGYVKVGILRIDKPEDAHDTERIKRVQYAHCVFFTGGDQKKLVSLIGGSPLMEAIHRKYFNDPHFVVAGTSAGAMSMPAHMLSRGVIEEAIFKSDIEMSAGLGLIEGVIVDTHFIKRGRFGRLAFAVASTPEARIGMGLGEDTAMVISNGNELECHGSGTVVVIDGTDLADTNIEAADAYTPIAMTNLKVHLLTEGRKYFLKERKWEM